MCVVAITCCSAEIFVWNITVSHAGGSSVFVAVQ